MRRLNLFTLAAAAACGLAQVSSAAMVATTSHAHNGGVAAPGAILNSIVAGDLLQEAGVVASESNAATGWHGANPAPADRLPSITDGMLPAHGLVGLLNDFSSAPVNTFRYDLPGPRDVGEIRIIGGNFGGDGRIFITTVVEASTDGVNFFPVGGYVPGIGPNASGYYQSDASGVVNVNGNPGNISGEQNNPYEETLISITDDASATLLAGVTNLRFSMFMVDNTGGQMRDPFDGVNPYTGVDDFLTGPNSSPLIWEIDVMRAVPEPSAIVLAALAGLGVVCVRRRRK